MEDNSWFGLILFIFSLLSGLLFGIYLNKKLKKKEITDKKVQTYSGLGGALMTFFIMSIGMEAPLVTLLIGAIIMIIWGLFYSKLLYYIKSKISK